jgi:glycosyltransferase involved in cell wall biosynthesis
MKVLITIHDYLPLHLGGSELHAHQVAKELLRKGHEVNVLFTERDLERPEGDFTEGEFEGVPTIEVVHSREYPDLRQTWEQTFFAEVFRAQLLRLRPDVVHFHHLSLWGAKCLEVAREEGVRTVLTLHDFNLICSNSVLLKEDRDLCDGGGERGDCSTCLPADLLREERWQADSLADALQCAARERRSFHQRVLQCADVVVSPSQTLIDRFQVAGMLRAQRTELLMYGYPGDRALARVRDMAAPLRVGYVGGIYPSKGVHVLVDALAKLAEVSPVGPGIELVIHGHMDWFPDYSAGLLDAAQGSASIEFAGPFPAGEAARILAGFDVLVVPSIWYENRPITISEAFLAGVVPVVTDLGGMAESVRNGVDGLVFPRGDSAALGAALLRLAHEPGLFDKLSAGRPDLPDIPAVTDTLLGFYHA